jgi:hypothetical protein
MRQRKATAYPHWGALVQPRPGDRYLPSTRRCHENDPPTAPRQGFELTHPRCRFRGGVPAPRTSALTAAGSGHPSQRCRAAPTGSIITGQRNTGRSPIAELLASPSMIKRPVPAASSVIRPPLQEYQSSYPPRKAQWSTSILDEWSAVESRSMKEWFSPRE